MKYSARKRKKLRLNNYDYSSKQLYFITLCVKDRLEILGKIDYRNCIKLTIEGNVVKQYLKKIEQTYENVTLDEYIIMPNHIHMILSIKKNDGITISRIIKQYKMYVSKEIKYSMWQKSFYEHIIRTGKEYWAIKTYIKNNIINWKNDRYFKTSL